MEWYFLSHPGHEAVKFAMVAALDLLEKLDEGFMRPLPTSWEVVHAKEESQRPSAQ